MGLLYIYESERDKDKKNDDFYEVSSPPNEEQTSRKKTQTQKEYYQ
jgi:hypothetical protein